MNIQDSTTKELSDSAKKLIEEGIKKASTRTRKVERQVKGIVQEFTPLLEDMTNEAGDIPVYRINTASKVIEDYEQEIRDVLEDEFMEMLEEVIADSRKSIGKTFASIAIVDKLLSNKKEEEIEQEVLDFILEREISGISAKRRIAGVIALMVGDFRKTLRYGISLKESVSEIMKRIVDVVNKGVWQIERLLSTEALTSIRATFAMFGDKFGLIKGIKIIDNRGRHRYHERHMCYKYAEKDKYGMGKGIYKISDVHIFDPHPQCTAYFELVFEDGVLTEGEDV